MTGTTSQRRVAKPIAAFALGLLVFWLALHFHAYLKYLPKYLADIDVARTGVLPLA